MGDFEFLGTCISTVDDHCIWDATEMAQLIENSSEVNPYGLIHLLSGLSSAKNINHRFKNNPSSFEAGYYGDTYWIWDADKDIHYFFRKVD